MLSAIAPNKEANFVLLHKSRSWHSSSTAIFFLNNLESLQLILRLCWHYTWKLLRGHKTPYGGGGAGGWGLLLTPRDYEVPHSLLLTHHTSKRWFWRNICNGATPAPRRSRKWSFTYRIGSVPRIDVVWTVIRTVTVVNIKQQRGLEPTETEVNIHVCTKHSAPAK